VAEIGLFEFLQCRGRYTFLRTKVKGLAKSLPQKVIALALVA